MDISEEKVQQLNEAFENNPEVKKEVREALNNKVINVKKEVARLKGLGVKKIEIEKKLTNN